MKTSIYNITRKIALLITAVFIFYTAMSFNTIKKKDCNSENLLSKGFDRLKKYSLVKGYPFSFKEKKKDKPADCLKQIVTLNRGVKYKFFAVHSEDFDGKPVITIHNNEKQEFLLASSYNFNFKTFYEEINFECKTTGNYCLGFSFLDGKEGCAVGIMAFLE